MGKQNNLQICKITILLWLQNVILDFCYILNFGAEENTIQLSTLSRLLVSAAFCNTKKNGKQPFHLSKIKVSKNTCIPGSLSIGQAALFIRGWFG